MTTESRVRSVLGREGYLEDNFSVSSKLEDDIGMDSLDRMEFTMGLEEEFGISEIEPNDECDWVTLLDVVQYVDRMKG
jgi:acyl carrier protein